MSDKTLDLAYELAQERQQTAELREQLSERDAEVERLRGWMRRISALVVFDGGIGGSPSPAGEEHDLFTRVERLVAKFATAERELEAERGRLTSWLRLNMRFRAMEFGRLAEKSEPGTERYIRNSAASCVIDNTANEFDMWARNMAAGYEPSKEREMFDAARKEGAEG